MKVSVVIPCYNVSGFAERAVRSVWAQDHSDMDIVAIDDGSSDGTLAVLQELSRSGEGRLTVIEQERRGASAARNRGVAATQGSYIQFLDADDRLLPGKITRQVEQAIACGHPAIIAGAYRNEWEDGRDIEVIPGTDPWLALVQGMAGTTTSNLWSREAVVSAGSWTSELASSQDHDLVFRMLRDGGTYVLDKVVGAVILKRSSASISRTDPIGNWQRYIELRSAIRDHWRLKWGGERPDVIAEAEQYIFGAVRAIARSDRKMAVSLRDTYLTRRYEPVAGIPASRGYVSAHRVLGFQVTEMLARALDTLRQWPHR